MGVTTANPASKPELSYWAQDMKDSWMVASSARWQHGVDVGKWKGDLHAPHRRTASVMWDGKDVFLNGNPTPAFTGVQGPVWAVMDLGWLVTKIWAVPSVGLSSDGEQANRPGPSPSTEQKTPDKDIQLSSDDEYDYIEPPFNKPSIKTQKIARDIQLNSKEITDSPSGVSANPARPKSATSLRLSSEDIHEDFVTEYDYIDPELNPNLQQHKLALDIQQNSEEYKKSRPKLNQNLDPPKEPTELQLSSEEIYKDFDPELSNVEIKNPEPIRTSTKEGQASNQSPDKPKLTTEGFVVQPQPSALFMKALKEKFIKKVYSPGIHGLSNILNTNKKLPEQIPKEEPPIETPKEKSPIQTPKEEPPKETPREKSPVQTQKQGPPILTPTQGLPGKSDKEEPPIPTQKDGLPIQTPKEVPPIKTTKEGMSINQTQAQLKPSGKFAGRDNAKRQAVRKSATVFSRNTPREGQAIHSISEQPECSENKGDAIKLSSEDPEPTRGESLARKTGTASPKPVIPAPPKPTRPAPPKPTKIETLDTTPRPQYPKHTTGEGPATSTSPEAPSPITGKGSATSPGPDAPSPSTGKDSATSPSHEAPKPTRGEEPATSTSPGAPNPTTGSGSATSPKPEPPKHTTGGKPATSTSPEPPKCTTGGKPATSPAPDAPSPTTGKGYATSPSHEAPKPTREEHAASTSPEAPKRTTRKGLTGATNELGREGALTQRFGTSVKFVVRRSHSITCPYWEVCDRFIDSLGLPGIYFESNHDKCFCMTCIFERGDELYYSRGVPPKVYRLPGGWCRFGLKVPAKAHGMNTFAQWHTAFHGTVPGIIRSIIESDNLLMPGDYTIDGIHLAPPPDHINEETKPYKEFDIKQVFVSPTIIYAGLDTYAKPQSWTDPETGKKHQIKVALQVRIKPDSYKVGPETLGLGSKKIDAKFDNNELEWSTKIRGATILQGILVKYY